MTFQVNVVGWFLKVGVFCPFPWVATKKRDTGLYPSWPVARRPRISDLGGLTQGGADEPSSCRLEIKNKEYINTNNA